MKPTTSIFTIVEKKVMPQMSLKTILPNKKVIEIDDSERQPCEVYSRIIGYYRPVTIDAYKTTEWNIGKTAEHKERKYFSEKYFS